MSEASGSLNISHWDGNEVECYEYREFEIRIRKRTFDETISDHHKPFKHIKDLDELLEGIHGRMSPRDYKEVAKKMIYFIKRHDNIAPSTPNHFNALTDELEEVIDKLKDE